MGRREGAGRRSSSGRTSAPALMTSRSWTGYEAAALRAVRRVDSEPLDTGHPVCSGTSTSTTSRTYSSPSIDRPRSAKGRQSRTPQSGQARSLCPHRAHVLPSTCFIQAARSTSSRRRSHTPPSSACAASPMPRRGRGGAESRCPLCSQNPALPGHQCQRHRPRNDRYLQQRVDKGVLCFVCHDLRSKSESTA